MAIFLMSWIEISRFRAGLDTTHLPYLYTGPSRESTRQNSVTICQRFAPESMPLIREVLADGTTQGIPPD